MLNAAMLVAIVGVGTFANADPVPDPNWIVAGDPNFLNNNPAIEMMKRMGGFFPKFDFSQLPSPDSLSSTLVSGGGKGIYGIATTMQSKGHLDEDGKWVNDVQGSTIVSNDGDVKQYDLNGPVA